MCEAAIASIPNNALILDHQEISFSVGYCLLYIIVRSNARFQLPDDAVHGACCTDGACCVVRYSRQVYRSTSVFVFVGASVPISPR